MSFILVNISTAVAEEKTNIELADLSINRAFSNVLLVEQQGANTTELLAKLNVACELFSKAKNIYNSGSTENVTLMAESARSIADQVNSDAISLQLITANESNIVLIKSILFSSVGAITVVIVLVIFWRSFKSSYIKKILKLKPESGKN